MRAIGTVPEKNPRGSRKGAKFFSREGGMTPPVHRLRIIVG